MPALMCTTVPPAKSIAPFLKTQPASALTSSSLACAAVFAAASPAAASALPASEAADEVRAAGEGEAVTVQRPEDDDDAHGVEHLHQHREHVLGTDQATVE